jgi:hypothetical protein
MGSSRCQVRSMSAQVIHDGRLLAAPVRSMYVLAAEGRERHVEPSERYAALAVLMMSVAGVVGSVQMFLSVFQSWPGRSRTRVSLGAAEGKGLSGATRCAGGGPGRHVVAPVHPAGYR